MAPKILPIWRFFGIPSINWAGEELAPKLSKKALGMLAFMASNPGAAREEVAVLLWPGRSDGGLQNLRQCLSDLRKVFGPEYSRILDIGPKLSVHSADREIDFQRLLDIQAGAPTSTEEVLDLCRGDFLQKLKTGSDAFDHWADSQRNRYKHTMVRVILSALKSAQAAGRDNEAVRLTALLRPLAEDIADDVVPPAQPNSSPHRFFWSALVAVVASIFTAVATWLVIETRSITQPPSITVDRFTAVNGSPVEFRIAGGVTLGVNYALHTVSDILVVTSASEEPGTPCERATDLGVRYVVMGSVAVNNGLVRVSVSTLDATDCTYAWSDKFDMQMADTFNLQDAITLRILQEIGIEISSAERNRIENIDDAKDLDAWLAAAKGVRYLIRLTESDLAIAKTSYQEALKIDPDYLSARRGLAWIAFLGVRLGWIQGQDARSAAIKEAENQIRLVLRQRPNDGLATSVDAFLHLHHRECDEAEKLALRSTKLLPGSADVWAVYAYILTYTGDSRRSIEAMDKAMELSPMHPGWYGWTKARALRLSGRNDEALVILDAERDKTGPIIILLVELAMAYVEANRIDDARSIAEEIRKLFPGLTASEWTSTYAPVCDPDVQSTEFELLSKAGL